MNTDVTKVQSLLSVLYIIETLVSFPTCMKQNLKIVHFLNLCLAEEHSRVS